MKYRAFMKADGIGAVALLLLMAPGMSSAVSFDNDVSSLSSQIPSERGNAEKRLKKGGADAVAALVRGLSTPDKKHRVDIVQTIVNMKRESKSLQARDADVHAMGDYVRKESDPAMRTFMVDAIRDLKGLAALKELERFASEDADESVRRDALLGVTNVSDKEMQFLRNETLDKGRRVRLIAYGKLAKFGDKSGRDLAVQTLNGPANDLERLDAIYALGEIGDSRDIAALKQVSDSPNEKYKLKINARQAVKTIELLQLPAKDRLAFLMTSLDDSDALVRDWAFTELWNWPDAATSVRLRLYLMEPGHRGYKEAADALRLR